MIETIEFDERGLAPCVIQDAATGEVLTLAYVNAEALERTIETGEIHLWSRSRDELWHKGATSGNVQRSASSATTATPTPCSRWSTRRGPPATPVSGPASTGRSTATPQPVTHEATAARSSGRSTARRAERPDGSYTAELLADPALIGAKVREEADEVARAVAGESDERVAEEAADLLYHLEVALASRGLGIGSSRSTVLNARRRDG